MLALLALFAANLARAADQSRPNILFIIFDDWGWQHIEAGEENAPSHVRASLAGPQVLVPIDGGRLALGTWQGIFFCELDGPRTRTVYVSVLQ